MTLFDRWIVVDWSAAARPVTGTNSIWIAIADRDTVELLNPSTRAQAIDLLVRHIEESGPTMVGIDASFGLPAGAASALSPRGDGEPWQRLWATIVEVVVDADDNTNNRFEAAASLNQAAGEPAGPFWGHPPTWKGEGLEPTRPGFPWGSGRLPEYRHAELLLREAAFGIQSTWKIAYQGSVGGQFLMLIPQLMELRARRSRVRVWPFETGFERPPSGNEVWVGELWPGEFELGGHHQVRDADQVATAVREIRRLDQQEALLPWFRGPTDPAVRAVALTEEGWPWSPTLSALNPARANAS